MPLVIDYQALRRHRDRKSQTFSSHDFLYREAGTRLIDRLNDIKRTFPLALNLGARDGSLSSLLLTEPNSGIETIIEQELSPRLCTKSQQQNEHTSSGRIFPVCAIPESLPFKPETFDLVFSCNEIHWINDLPATLTNTLRILKPDGLFLACCVGGSTLHELRHCLRSAEIEITGGLSPRIIPMIELEDAARLLQRSGFALPVVDREIITLEYTTPTALLRDLQAMGGSNALTTRHRAPLRRDILARACQTYESVFSERESGNIRATIELVFMIGWKPHPDQPQPLPRGSATASLAEALTKKEKEA